MLKKITSGDMFQVEKKNLEPYTSTPLARCVFAANILPPFLDKSNGLWDRARIIPFNTVVRGSNHEIPDLAGELKKELSGILNWALKGLEKLKQLPRFPHCKEGKFILEQHRLSCDHEREFLLDNVELKEGEKISSKNLFSRYKADMLEKGYQAVGQSRFNESVKRTFKGCLSTKERSNGQNMSIFLHLSWRDTPADPFGGHSSDSIFTL